jgi:hypothetical protein
MWTHRQHWLHTSPSISSTRRCFATRGALHEDASSSRAQHCCSARCPLAVAPLAYKADEKRLVLDADVRFLSAVFDGSTRLADALRSLTNSYVRRCVLIELIFPPTKTQRFGRLRSTKQLLERAGALIDAQHRAVGGYSRAVPSLRSEPVALASRGVGRSATSRA